MCIDLFSICCAPDLSSSSSSSAISSVMYGSDYTVSRSLVRAGDGGAGYESDRDPRQRRAVDGGMVVGCRRATRGRCRPSVCAAAVTARETTAVVRRTCTVVGIRISATRAHCLSTVSSWRRGGCVYVERPWRAVCARATIGATQYTELTPVQRQQLSCTYSRARAYV